MTVGILGGGQLGRMLALAGYPMGLGFVFLEPKAGSPVAGLGRVVKAPYDDRDGLASVAGACDVVTYEFENVPVDAARFLQERDALVHPAPAALEMAQDRLAEKTGFRDLGIPTAPFVTVDTLEQLRAGVERLGAPAVLKTRRMGYDGKGQVVIRSAADVDEAWDRIGGVPLLLEAFVDFDRELSILAVRGRDGRTSEYPLVENHHEEGVLRLSIAPAAGVPQEVQAKAEAYADRLMERLEYVGVLAIELFQRGDELFANEMAPRVHNSGHWTLDGAHCSQFENHLRAVCGLPLGSTAARGHSVMVNLLGRVPDRAELLGIPGAHLHLYGKEARPGRKLGHVNVVGHDPATVRETGDRVLALAKGAP